MGGSRKGKIRRDINLLITFLVSGIWHGSGLQYLFWGLMQGGYQIAGEVMMPLRKRVKNCLKIQEESWFYRLWQRGCTFVLITFSWIIFRADSLRSGLSMIKRILTDVTPWIFFDGTLYTCGIGEKQFLVLLLCIALVVFVEHLQEKGLVRDRIAEQHMLVRWGIYLGAIALIAVFGVYGPGYDATQFLYGQF